MIDIILDEKGRLWSRLSGGQPISPAEAFSSLTPGTDQQFRLYLVRCTGGNRLEPLPLRAGTTTMELVALVHDIEGDLSVSVGGDTAVASGKGLGELAQSLQAGLNSLTTIHNAGGLKVYVSGWRGLDVAYEVTGDQTAITADVSALRPIPDGTITTPVAGDGSTREVQRILLGEKTLATITSWSTIATRDTYEFTQAGDANAAALYEISLADPIPAAGSFTLDLGGTVTDPIPLHYGAKNVQTLIDSAWGADLFTVRKPYPYTWRLQRTAVGALTTPTADVGGVEFHPGISATVDLSSAANFAQTAGSHLHLRAIIRTDLTGQGDSEVFRADFRIPSEKLES